MEARVDPLVVHVHLPKTAGTTLTRLLRHHYRGAFRGAGNAIGRPGEVEDRLRTIARKRRIRAAAGHFPFGYADLLPPETRYVTVLREPVARTISHYRFLLQARDHGLLPAHLPRPGTDLSLEEALGTYIPDNVQTRMLCGLRSLDGALPAAALDDAKRNLRDRFAFVGTTERFDELVARMNVELGLPTLAFAPARAKGTGEGFAADDVALAGERNALDRELHAYAGELARIDGDVRAELDVLRRANEAWRTGAEASDERVAAAIEEARLAEREEAKREERKAQKAGSQ